ncbi:MAG: hypothetical protein CMJ39_08485 [Phycisphaerae bacterium]|nr:hypothetical protein [Phycisphaerae bacterium]
MNVSGNGAPSEGEPLKKHDSTDSTSVAQARGRRWYYWRLLAMVIGILLLVGAIVMVALQRDTIASAFQAMAQPQPGPILLLIASMLATIFVTGVQFNLLLSRHRLPMLEMQGLIAGSALLNFLPLKAGLLGRITYHQVVNGIRPLETVQAMLLARGSGLVVIGFTALALFLRDLADGPLWAYALLPAVVPGWFLMARFTRITALVVILKYGDLLLMAIRYYCAFMLMGETIGFDVCMGLACIGMLAGAIPFLTGGLGLREWLVGWFTTILVVMPGALELGLLADLINRGIELAVLIPVGGVSILWLRPRFVRSLKEAQARQQAELASVSQPRSPDP